MAIDFIARAAAAAARSSGGAAPAAFVFTALGTKTLDAALTALTSSGYTTAGQGAAAYVTDALATSALAAAHPRCCKASADGRYWRLVPSASGKNNFRQVGVVVGTVTDNFAAIQALFDYAAAVGLIRLTLPHGRVEVWQSLRTAPVNDTTPDGSLAVKSSLIIDSEGRTTLDFKGRTGGDPNSDYQTIAGYGPYRGGGLQLYGDNYPWPNDPDDWKIQFFEMENVRLKGNRTVGFGVSLPDEKDKGIYMNNAVRNISLRDVEVDHFCYELLYGGNYQSPFSDVRLERVKAHHSGQSCLNFTYARNITDIDGQYGDTYTAGELFGANYNLTRTRFYKAFSVGFSSSRSTDIPSGGPYNLPSNSPPLNITTLDAVVCDRVQTVYAHAHVYGDVNIIDGQLSMGAFAGDIDLKATVTLDRASGLTAAIIEGPAAVPTGIYTDTILRNVNIELNAVVSRYGLSQGYSFASIFSSGGYMDPETVKLHVAKAGPNAGFWGNLGNLHAMPLVTCDFARQRNSTNAGQVPGYDQFIDAAYVLYPYFLGITAYAGAAAIPITFAAVGAGGAYEGLAHGQRFKFFYGEDSFGGAGSFSFLHNGTGMALTGDLVLNKAGSWIEFEYNRRLGKWIDVARFAPA